MIRHNIRLYRSSVTWPNGLSYARLNEHWLMWKEHLGQFCSRNRRGVIIFGEMEV